MNNSRIIRHRKHCVTTQSYIFVPKRETLSLKLTSIISSTYCSHSFVNEKPTTSVLKGSTSQCQGRRPKDTFGLGSCPVGCVCLSVCGSLFTSTKVSSGDTKGAPSTHWHLIVSSTNYRPRRKSKCLLFLYVCVCVYT